MNQAAKLPVTIDIGDGFDDFDDDADNRSSLIKGLKLKYLDGGWRTRDGAIAPDLLELVVINIVKAIQKWVPGQNGPADMQVLPAGAKFPDVAAMNEAAPKEEWRERYHKPTGPWEAVYGVYLVDMKTMQTYTFVAPVAPEAVKTIGSVIAVKELKERIRLARRVKNADVFAIVTLGSTFMPTQWGGKDRPHFEIKRYELLGGQERQQIEHKEVVLEPAKPDEPEVLAPKPTPKKAKARVASGAKPKARSEPVPQDNDDDEEAGEGEALFEDGEE